MIIFNCILFFAIGGFIFSRNTLGKKINFTIILISLIAVVVTFFASKRSYNELVAIKYAIIYSPASYVKSSPDDKSTDLFILHSGTKVKLLDEVGAWYQVLVEDGNKGWLKKETIKII